MPAMPNNMGQGGQGGMMPQQGQYMGQPMQGQPDPRMMMQHQQHQGQGYGMVPPPGYGQMPPMPNGQQGQAMPPAPQMQAPVQQ
jgi:hypothetical protein